MMKIDQHQRDYIDRMVNIWLSGMMCNSNDAGWQGMSLAARLIEYIGQPPIPSGYDQSNMHMIISTEMLRRMPPEYAVIAPVMCMLFAMHDTRKPALAIAAKHYYRGLCIKTDRTWTDTDRANDIGMTLDEYRWALKQAYPAVSKEILRSSVMRNYVSAHETERDNTAASGIKRLAYDT